MTHVALAKFIISNVAGLSSSYIAKTIINNNVVTPTTAERVFVGIGKFAIGGMVAEAVTRNTNQRLDELEEAVNKFNTEQKDSSN